MKAELWHGKDSSAIIADGVIIEYTRRIHRYESESDFKTLVTEDKTYGDNTAKAWLDYLATTHQAAK